MHEDREYPNRLIFSLAAGVEQDGLKVDRAVLAVTRPIGARLTGSASLSYIWTKPDVSVYEDFKGTGWSAELDYIVGPKLNVGISARSEEHTSELQSLMRNSYAVFCLKKTNNKIKKQTHIHQVK